MNVATILKHKGSEVVTTDPATRLGEIARILHDNRVGCIVVVDEANKVIGIVSERDIVICLARQGAEVLEQPVGRCMTSRVHTCTRTDTLEKLMGEMTAHRFRHLPVVEDGELIGLVSIGDVVKQRIAETEMEASSLRDYIKTG